MSRGVAEVTGGTTVRAWIVGTAFFLFSKSLKWKVKICLEWVSFFQSFVL